MSTPIRAVAYYRKSNNDKGEIGESIEQQRDWAKDASAREGVSIVAEFHDQSVSGLDTSRRTDFHRMIGFIEEQARLGKPIECILCWHANRFSRADSLETSAFLFRCREAGVSRMLTKAKWIDFNRSEDRMIFGLEQEANSHRYVRDLGEAVLRGRKALARKGLWCGGQPPFGYVVEGKKLVPHPTNGETVRWLFNAYATRDVGLDRLGRELADRGIKSPKGGLWSRATLSGILQNPTYLGDLVYNRRTESPFAGSVTVKTGRSARAVRDNPPADWVRTPNAHPPLVTWEVFEQVQQKLTANRTRTTPLKNNPFLLVGLVRCGHCQGPMTGRTLMNGKGPASGVRTRTRYYQCNRYNTYGPQSGCQPNFIREDRLVAALAKKLTVALVDPAVLEEMKREIRRQETDDTATPERSLAARIAELDRNIRTGTERFLTAPEALVESCRASLTTWKAERDRLAAELDAARARNVAVEDLDARVEKIASRINRLREVFEQGEPTGVRAALREVIERIELWFDYSSRPKGVRNAFARGLIYVNSGSLSLTDLSTAGTSPSPTVR
jgi:site-specific DNA recombinase